MRKLLNFCLVLCSIVLLALFTVPDVAHASTKERPEKVSCNVVDLQAEAVFVLANHVLRFNPGSLPFRIQVPTSEVSYIGELENDISMDLENRKLNAILYRDLDPGSPV